MTYFIIAALGVALGYLIRSVDLTARSIREDHFDVFPVNEPPSNLLDVDNEWLDAYRRWNARS